MNSTYLKFAAAALLFLLWTVLVCTGHADPGLIDAIKFALGALGFYHAATNLQGNDQLSMLLHANSAPAVTSSAVAEEVAALLEQRSGPQSPLVITVPSKPNPKEPQ